MAEMDQNNEKGPAQVGSAPKLKGLPPHPKRVLLDTANRAGRFFVSHYGVHGQATPNAIELLYIPDELLIELTIEWVEPPSTWHSEHNFRVGFMVKNGSRHPTTGFVHGGVTQATWKDLVSSTWFQPEAAVINLQPGQVLRGILQLNVWTGFTPTSGSADIDLQYWVEDPRGTITFVFPDRHHDATYTAISFAQRSIEVPAKRFATDIRPLFRDEDIQAMKNVDFPIDLSSYDDVRNNAAEIYRAVDFRAQPNVASMPCDGRWPSEYLIVFKQWMDDGLLP